MKTLFSFAMLTLAVVTNAQPLKGVDKLLPLAIELASTNPGFNGLVDATTKFDADKAVAIQRVNPAKVAEARTLANAVDETGEYYVPMCKGAECPLLATVLKISDGEYRLLSVGMEQTAKDLAKAKASVVVEYNEAYVLFAPSSANTLKPLTGEHATRLNGLLAGSGFNAASSNDGLDLLRRINAQLNTLRN